MRVFFVLWKQMVEAINENDFISNARDGMYNFTVRLLPLSRETYFGNKYTILDDCEKEPVLEGILMCLLTWCFSVMTTLGFVYTIGSLIQWVAFNHPLVILAVLVFPTFSWSWYVVRRKWVEVRLKKM